MKKLLIDSGIVFLILNTLVGFLISSYQPFHFLSVNLIILVSVTLLYILTISDTSQGYKIGLSVLFVITGVIKAICIIVGPAQFQNNYFLIVALLVLAIEIVCLMTAMTVKKIE